MVLRTLPASTRTSVACVVLSLVVGANALTAQAPQARVYQLATVDGLRLHNVLAAPATLDGKAGLRVVGSGNAGQFATPGGSGQEIERLALVDGLTFDNGVIEVELAGSVAPDAPEGARGFVGLAFRVQPDLRTYDAFYLRPTNGRADDQERRNHSAQYIAHPDWTWFRLRKEFPSRYESYVDLVPGQWTSVKIEVTGDKARLFVHGQAQPTLVVNDVKSGPQGRGGIALWINPGTIAHFRNLRVQPAR